MRRLRAFLVRLFRVGSRRHNDRELLAEIESNLELEIADRVGRGADPGTARRLALLHVGDLEAAKDAYRDRRGFPAFDTTLQDLRYARRRLVRSPLFASVAVLTLGLGIGATTAVFTLVDAVLLKRLPVQQPDRLLLVDAISTRGDRYNLSYPFFQSLDASGVFDGAFAALDGVNHMEMTGPESGAQPEPMTVALVSGRYFDLLGVHASAGTVFTAATDRRDAPESAVVVLSHAFWKKRFAGDRGVVGRSVLIGRQPVVVIGVASAGFFGESVGQAPDAWAPLVMQPIFDRGPSLLDAGNVGWLRVFGRRPVNSRDADVRAKVDALLARLQADAQRLTPANRPPSKVMLSDGSRGTERFREQFALPLQILAGVVALVFLLACANVSTLLLARTATRRQELTIRLAIGADRRRLIRQLLTESLLLAILAGVLGVALGYLGSRALLVLASNGPAPVPIDVAPDARVLALTLLLALISVLAFGLAPAVTGSHTDLRGTTAHGSRAPRRSRLARMMIAAQLAFSLALLTAATLFIQTLTNLRTRDLGYSPQGIVQIRFSAPAVRREDMPTLSRHLLERLSVTPDVQSVTLAHKSFGGRISTTCCIAIEGWTPASDDIRTIRTLGVGPDYFKTLRLAVDAGRGFTDEDSMLDDRETRGPLIVNQAFLRRYLGTAQPIGVRIGWGNPPNVQYSGTIVGVVGDAVYEDVRAVPPPILYYPSLTGSWAIVRTTAPERLMPLLRREILKIDDRLEVSVSSLTAEVERAFVREKLLARLGVFFGAFAILLAIIGVYGVMASTVAQRSKEISIRMALGARRQTILWTEIVGAMRLTVLGCVSGSLLAIGAIQFVRNQLFGIAHPGIALVPVAALLIATAAAAAYWPARRAARVDPMAALKID